VLILEVGRNGLVRGARVDRDLPSAPSVSSEGTSGWMAVLGAQYGNNLSYGGT